jgi:hypothetical protein
VTYELCLLCLVQFPRSCTNTSRIVTPTSTNVGSYRIRHAHSTLSLCVCLDALQRSCYSANSRLTSASEFAMRPFVHCMSVCQFPITDSFCLINFPHVHLYASQLGVTSALIHVDFRMYTSTLRSLVLPLCWNMSISTCISLFASQPGYASVLERNWFPVCTPPSLRSLVVLCLLTSVNCNLRVAYLTLHDFSSK